MARREVDLNELFAHELAATLNEDPELRYEVTETRATLREWVTDQVRQQTENDDMSQAIRRFIRQHLTASKVMEFF